MGRSFPESVLGAVSDSCLIGATTLVVWLGLGGPGRRGRFVGGGTGGVVDLGNVANLGSADTGVLPCRRGSEGTGVLLGKRGSVDCTLGSTLANLGSKAWTDDETGVGALNVGCATCGFETGVCEENLGSCDCELVGRGITGREGNRGSAGMPYGGVDIPALLAIEGKALLFGDAPADSCSLGSDDAPPAA